MREVEDAQRGRGLFSFSAYSMAVLEAARGAVAYDPPLTVSSIPIRRSARERATMETESVTRRGRSVRASRPPAAIRGAASSSGL